LRRLHGKKLIAIHRLGDNKINIRALERVGNRFGERSRAVCATSFENARNFFRRDERPGRVMDSDEISGWVEMLQAGTHRIVTKCSTGHDLPDLCFRRKNLAQLWKTVAASDQNDFIDAICALKGVDGVRDDGLVSQWREDFIETHALAATRGDDDGA